MYTKEEKLEMIEAYSKCCSAKEKNILLEK